MEIRTYMFSSTNSLIIPICTNCLQVLTDKSIKLDKKIYHLFENLERIRFCSKTCENEYFNNNPLVAYQITMIKKRKQ